MNNTLLLILVSILFIIGFLIAIHICNKRNQTIRQLKLENEKLETLKIEEIKNHFEKEWNKEEKELDTLIRTRRADIENESIKMRSDFQISKTELDGIINQLDVLLKEKEKRYNEVNQDLNLYRQGKIKEIDGTAAEYEQRKRTEIEQSLKELKQNISSDFNNYLDSYTIRKAQMESELNEVQKALEEERTKRAAINDEIRRQREVEEQQDFYRIQLDPNDKDDVEILRSVAPRLRHPEAINKVIWTGYYQKPLAELRKRLLPNGDISGVYKITRLKTGEIYIGQTTSIDKRWQEHTKSALGVGTLASSQLHRAMAQDGAENFTFEVLEETPKDKLRERESYYIDFYDSKTYGLNSVTGDKNK